jgi:hypothetical protein
VLLRVVEGPLPGRQLGLGDRAVGRREDADVLGDDLLLLALGGLRPSAATEASAARNQACLFLAQVGGGLGLGLGGAKRLSNEFEISSRLGEGTRVSITRWK